MVAISGIVSAGRRSVASHIAPRRLAQQQQRSKKKKKKENKQRKSEEKAAYVTMATGHVKDGEISRYNRKRRRK